jgi:hypothetical protein
MSSEQEFLIFSGSMLHNLGAHTAKARSPNVVVFVDGTARRHLALDLRLDYLDQLTLPMNLLGKC